MRTRSDVGVGTLVTAFSSLLSAVKAQTTTTNATFTPADQALESAVEAGSNAKIVDVPLPAYYVTGNQVIDQLLKQVDDARAATVDKLNSAHSSDPTYNISDDLKPLDTLQSNLQQALVTSPSGSASSLVYGAAILAEVGAISDGIQLADFKPKGCSVLILSTDAAGGGTRTRQFLLLSFLVPWPNPSFNGGAIVSYSFKGQDGKTAKAGTYRYVSGYAKWKTPKNKDRQYSNLPK